MTRDEILAVDRPILFNTEMVRAILDGRKTKTRRVIKPQPEPTESCCANKYTWYHRHVSYALMDDCDVKRECAKAAPYHPGDILWVRETWNADWCDHVIYKADGGSAQAAGYSAEPKWRPSIHMPKEAARIFLRVIGVRAERLQEINGTDLEQEGINTGITHFKSQFNNFGNAERFQKAQKEFSVLWDSTIKPADLPLYGWDANPWVWVIEFEKMEANRNG